MNYSLTTNLFSDYNLPTPEARHAFAKFRTNLVTMRTADVYSVFRANVYAVERYKNDANTQGAACAAAARRDFAAAMLNVRGLRFDYEKNDFDY